MKNKKGSIEAAGVAAILIVCVIIAAFVVPWVLSLVDTTPPDPGPEGEYARRFHMAPGTVHTAWVSQRMTFAEDVEVNSLHAILGRWGPATGSCTLQGQFQVSNAIGASASVQFQAQDFAVAGNMIYFGDVVGGGQLAAGTYYLAMRGDCVEPGLADDLMWYFSFADNEFDESITLVRNCNDLNGDGYWNPDSGLECHPAVLSFILEGNVGWAEWPPPDVNETAEEPPPPLVDTTGEDEDYDWIMYAILGGVIIIVLIVVMVAVRW